MLNFFSAIGKFFKAIDPKLIIIGIFAILFIVFFSMWYFQGSSNKDAIKALHDQNKEIVLDRDNIKKELDSLKRENIVLVNIRNGVETQLTQTEILLQKYIQQSGKSTGSLVPINAALERTAQQIKELKANPANRTDDALIKSLKEKLNK